MGDDAIFVGVLRLVIRIPGARTLKDRRQVVGSLMDRIRHRFPVSVHPVDTLDHPGRQVVVCTTAGNDGRVLRINLDKIAGFAASTGGMTLGAVDVDVFRWHAPDDLSPQFPPDDPADPS
jgi:uncharacterized protein YlxP (DUF503 family)